MDSACALVAKGQVISQVSSIMGVSRAQFSVRVHRSDDWQYGRTLQRDEEADAEVLSRILGIISGIPSDGYRRVWRSMRKQLCAEGLPTVNARRVYSVMSKHKLLLLHDTPQLPQREYNGKITVAESNQCWCSDGFKFGCDDGESCALRSHWTDAT